MMKIAGYGDDVHLPAGALTKGMNIDIDDEIMSLLRELEEELKDDNDFLLDIERTPKIEDKYEKAVNKAKKKKKTIEKVINKFEEIAKALKRANREKDIVKIREILKDQLQKYVKLVAYIRRLKVEKIGEAETIIIDPNTPQRGNLMYLEIGRRGLAKTVNIVIRDAVNKAVISGRVDTDKLSEIITSLIEGDAILKEKPKTKKQNGEDHTLSEDTHKSKDQKNERKTKRKLPSLKNAPIKVDSVEGNDRKVAYDKMMTVKNIPRYVEAVLKKMEEGKLSQAFLHGTYTAAKERMKEHLTPKSEEALANLIVELRRRLKLKR